MAQHSATLNWVASTDSVDGYNVYRGTNPPGNEGATPINSALVTGTSYVDLSITVGQKYDYYVTAVKNGIESAHSNEVITAVLLPQGPTGLTVVMA